MSQLCIISLKPATVGQEFAEYDRDRDRALAAVAELREFARDIRLYCKSRGCDPQVSLEAKHPIAVKINDWYIFNASGCDIDTACVRYVGGDEVLDLWREFTSRTMMPVDWGHARVIALKIAETLEARYAPSSLSVTDRTSKQNSVQKVEFSRAIQPTPKVDVSSPRLTLFGQGKPVAIDGETATALGPHEYAVVKPLVRAYPRRPSKDELIKLSGCDHAPKVLSRLRDSRPDLAPLILMAGKPGRGYGIAGPDLP